MKNTAYRLGEFKIIEKEFEDLSWETHIGLGSLKSGKCFMIDDILFIKSSDIIEPGFLKGEFIDHINKLPKWEKTKYFCTSYKIYQCKPGCSKQLLEAKDGRLQEEKIPQEIESTQKQIVKADRKSVETDAVELASYKLRRYKILQKIDDQLFWESTSGLTDFKKGRCYIKGSILFLEPGKTKRSEPIKKKFMQQLINLPDWQETQYFCPSYTIYYCKTGSICRSFEEDNDLKKGEAEKDVVAGTKVFDSGIKTKSIILNKIITKENLKTFFKFSIILVMLILELLAGCFRLIYKITKALIGRWTRFLIKAMITGRKRVR